MNIPETIQQLTLTVDQLRTERDELQARESVVDKEISHHYHVLEMVTMNAAQLAKVTKSLRTVLKLRRYIKESVIVLNSMMDGPTAGIGKRYADTVIRRNKANKEYKDEAEVSFKRIMQSQTS